MKLLNDLLRIDRAAKPTVNGGAIIVDDRGRYVSGVPYLWSGFRERAFVFKDVAQAQALIDKHRLQGATAKAVRD
jgi:hypothetical protein